jgi:hypothetical protein
MSDGKAGDTYSKSTPNAKVARPCTLAESSLPPSAQVEHPTLVQGGDDLVSPSIGPAAATMDEHFPPILSFHASHPDPLASPTSRQTPGDGGGSRPSHGISLNSFFAEAEIRNQSVPALALPVPDIGAVMPYQNEDFAGQASLSAGLSLGPYLSAASPLFSAQTDLGSAALSVSAPSVLQAFASVAGNELDSDQNRALSGGTQFDTGPGDVQRRYEIPPEAFLENPDAAAASQVAPEGAGEMDGFLPQQNDVKDEDNPAASVGYTTTENADDDANQDAMETDSTADAGTGLPGLQGACRADDEIILQGRVGRRRVYNPCGSCGAEMHIRFTVCRGCGAPKQPAARR